MQTHKDIYAAIADRCVYLHNDHPRTLMRLARVCRAAHLAVSEMLRSVIAERAEVKISMPTMAPSIRASVFDDSVHKLIGYEFERMSMFTWGNVTLTMYRSEVSVSVELSVDGYGIGRAKVDFAKGIIQNIHDRSSDDVAESLARFAVWLFPGIYHGATLVIMPGDQWCPIKRMICVKGLLMFTPSL